MSGGRFVFRFGQGDQGSQPQLPEAVSPTIGAGETFTIEIDPNQDWEASVPTATAAWFWIEDGTQKVWTLRGGAGPARIVIAAAELEEFDDNASAR